MEGPPFSELSKARGPVGGAFPDIVEPKEADVVEDEEREYRERVIDEAANLVLSLVDTRCGSRQIKSRPPFLLAISKTQTRHRA